ncbi:hypothetical protein ACFYZI_33285 [Streptomyces griseorubiginosus]
MNEGSSNPWLVAAQQIDARIEELRPEADRHVVGSPGRTLVAWPHLSQW